MTTEIWTGNQGTLCVYVSKAKDLPNLSKLDKQNVMLRLRIAHMTRESDTLLRAGQNPVFKYLEKYEITPEVRPVMQVEVYCDRKKKTPILIGRCEVDLLNGIRADPKEGYCSWYELKRERNEFAGTIFIELSFTPSLPRFEDEGRSEEIQRLDASMAVRPVPPLPGDLQASILSPNGSENVPPGRYMHASMATEDEPRLNSLRNSTSLGAPTNFSSSIGTSKSFESQDTAGSGGTATSDTKFHFANLKKLKERINVFKNPNSSTNIHSETPVDIAALQKAIGVTSISDDESTEDEDTYSRRISHRSKLELQPPLPALPTEANRSRSQSPKIPPLPRSRNQTTPLKLQPEYPRLPALPTSPGPRSREGSPKRPPPPRGV